MLIRKPQVNIFTRDVVLPTGEFVRAFFAVIETEGFREIKFLGTRSIDTAETAETAPAETLLLAAPVVGVFGDLFIPSYFEATAPFYTLDFLTSQSARAPSVR
jgi:hypothetical protein